MRTKKAKTRTQSSKKTARKTHSSKKKTEVKSKPKQPLPPVHPWRVCPYGEHWVRTHSLHIPPSKTHPEGFVTTRNEHCAHNPSGKDQLYPEEIQEIAEQHFFDLKNKPCPIDLGYHHKGDKYDDLIAGWVQYWNDVLKPDEPLDPNLVKALIATESSFDPNQLANKKDSNSARGLMQITNDTRKILGDEDGELKDHFLTITKSELNDPAVNICAGVRWLFHKRALLSSKLGHPTTWMETIGSYKGTAKTTKERAKSIMEKFIKKYGDLQKCERK